MANFNKQEKLNRIIFYNIFAFVAFISLLIFPFWFQSIGDKLLKSPKREILFVDSIAGMVGNSLRKQIESPYYTIFNANKKEYAPYEEIKFNLSIADKKTGEIIKHVIPEIVLKDEKGNILQDIFDKDKFRMIYSDQENYFEASIYLKDTFVSGFINVSLSVNDRFYTIATEEISVNVKIPKPSFQFPNTYTFLGLDSKDALSLRNILSTDGKETSVKQLSRWFRILNNDAVIMPSSITKVKHLSQYPWDREKLKESKHFAKEFFHKGVDVALWIQALEIEGKADDQTPYIMSKSDVNIKYKNITNDIISLLDQKRKQELIDILQEHMDDPYISYIGLSKTFFHQMNQELYDIFVSKYADRILFSPISDSFNRWKDIKIVEYYRSIFDQVEKKKPIFMMFNSQDVINFPEYIAMAYAAGIDFVIIDIDASLDTFSKQWEYIQKKSVISEYMPYTVLSYCLNYNNIISNYGSVIDNWVEANLSLFNKYNIQAIRINDFYHAMCGVRGPYSSYEWMLSIGELISKWKKSRRYYPLVTSYTANSGKISENITINMQLYNSSSYPISDVVVRILLLSESNKVFKYPIIHPHETIRMSVNLSQHDLKKSLIQKKTKFIGIQSEFTFQESNKKRISEVELVSFIDPDILEDPNYISDHLFETDQPFLFDDLPNDITFLDQLSDSSPDLNKPSYTHKSKKNISRPIKKNVKLSEKNNEDIQNSDIIQSIKTETEKEKKDRLKKEKREKLKKNKKEKVNNK